MTYTTARQRHTELGLGLHTDRKLRFPRVDDGSCVKVKGDTL